MSAPVTESKSAAENTRARSTVLASRGIHTAGQFAALMSTLIGDVLEGTITPGVCNAAVNAGGKLLRVVELRQMYGVLSGTEKELQLVSVEPPVALISHTPDVAQRIAALRDELARLEPAKAEK